MCGLAGIAGKTHYKNKDVLNDLLVIASLRGADSTGVAALKDDGQTTTIVKQIGNPYDLFQYKPYDSIAAHDKTVLMGHCRKATVGGISRYTAHPFESTNGRIVGVHNGTLTGWKHDFNRLRKGFSDDFETDSQCLIEAIGEFGVERALECADGAYAVVYYDKQDKTLNFFRNDKRTLWYSFSEDSKLLLWASEYEMINLTANRNGIPLMEKKGYRFWAFPENQLIKFTVDKTDGVEMVGCTDLPEYKRVTFTGNYGGGAAHTNVRSPFQPNTTNLFPTVQAELDEDKLPSHLLPRTHPDSTKTAEESKNTKQSTPSSKELSTSQQLPPLLTCVVNNKSDDSDKQTPNGKKNTTKTSVISSKGEKQLISFRGLELSEAEYNLHTYTACNFCDKDVSYKEALDGGIGRWMSYDSFLCHSCFKGETGLSDLPYVSVARH